MIGFSLTPLAFTKRAQISPSFDFSPPVQLRDASAKDLFGIALKNCPVSSMFHIFCGVYPCNISGSLSFHDSIVSWLTSPASVSRNKFCLYSVSGFEAVQPDRCFKLLSVAHLKP